jgi:hypothetical protein
MKKQTKSAALLFVCASLWFYYAPALAKEKKNSDANSVWQLVFENDTRTYEVKKTDVERQGSFAISTMRRLSKQSPDGYTLNVYAFNCDSPSVTSIRTGWESQDGKKSNWLTNMPNQNEWSKGDRLNSNSHPELVGAYEIVCDKKLQDKNNAQAPSPVMPGSWVNVGSDTALALELDQTSMVRQDEFILATLRKPMTLGEEAGYEIRRLAFNCATSQVSVVQVGFKPSAGKTAQLGKINTSAILRKYVESVIPNSELSKSMGIACTAR